MAYTPISGKDGKVTYGIGPSTVAVTGWTRTHTGGVLRLPNTTDGIRRIAGLADVTGTFDCHVDSVGTYETDLVPGTIVALNLYTTAAKKYTETSAIITDVAYKNEVEGSYDATYSWALASGTPATAPA